MSRVTQFAVAAITILGATGAAAFNSGSTSADGMLNPSAPVEIQLPESGVLNYASINIPNGVTVRFRRNALNTPVTLLVAGDAVIAGTIDISGKPGTPSFGAGDGNVADDGLPGEGGPGGFGGGAGGRLDASATATSLRVQQAGIGPGGGRTTPVNYLTSFYCTGAGGSFGTSGSIDCETVVSPPYGTADLLPLIGGSGGAGGIGSPTTGGSGGGGGGGALLLAVTGRLTISGTIRADGARGGDVGHAQSAAGTPGGGGSGGALRLVATTIEGNGALSVAGANSGGFTNVAYRTTGGAGRLRIEAETCTRPSCPSNLPGPLFVAGLPTLRIASVAGVAAPAAPTGSADIVLPSTTNNPVEVVIASSNVPLGTTVTVTVTPPRGNPISQPSTALQGTEASATATASVSLLLDGPYVFLASLSFAVAASQQASFAEYTDGEKVLRVELAAALDGASKTTLITESGRRVVL